MAINAGRRQRHRAGGKAAARGQPDKEKPRRRRSVQASEHEEENELEEEKQQNVTTKTADLRITKGFEQRIALHDDMLHVLNLLVAARHLRDVIHDHCDRCEEKSFNKK